MGAKLGFGTILAIAAAPLGTVFTDLANVTSITPFNTTRDAIDTTDMSTTDGYKTALGGLKDNGECTAEINYDPTAHNTLLADFDEADPMNYRITFPGASGEIASFAAVMTGFSPSVPMDEKMTASMTIKISGKIAWT